MAGDWIKVEVATARKPEVLRIANMLGISRRECMGLLFDFWAWLDANARTEVVPNLSRTCLDDVLNCPGFAAAVEVVGWLEWDDEAVSARVVNFDKHNSASAKTRAYEQKKKARQREILSPSDGDKTGTREEKRREEITTKSKAESVAASPPTTKRATRLPADWQLPRAWGEWAQSERQWPADEVRRVAALFADHWRGKGEARADWEATWRNWVRRERGGTGPPRADAKTESRSAFASAILGDVNHDQAPDRTNVRDITAEAVRVA